MAILFPSTPSDGDTVTIRNKQFRYSSTDGAWQQTANGRLYSIEADTFDGDGSTTVFTLSNASTTQALVVALNGIVQEGGAGKSYTVSGTTLTFTDAPSVGERVVARNILTVESDRILTATTTELNYVDGVTSAIQTQIDAKASLASPTFTGNVGIGTVSPGRQLTVSNSGASLLLLESTGDDNGQLLFGDSASDTVGKVIYRHADDRLTLQAGGTETVHVKGGNVGIGTSSPATALDITGDATVSGYIKASKGIVQTVHNSTNVAASGNPINTWSEINSNYRVSITPRYSDSRILGTFHIPMNPTGASNILMAIVPWYSTDGGSTKTIIAQGNTAIQGSRLNLSTSFFRSSNGFDGNDMQNHVVHFYHDPGTTGTVTYGWYFRSEGGNTTYFNHSNGNNGTWGWIASQYLELRELRT